MEDNVLDEIESEILEEQNKKTQDTQEENSDSYKLEGSTACKEAFVKKNTPSISTSYKDRLIKVYDELQTLKQEEIEEDLKPIKAELKIVIEEMEENEKRIQEGISNRIDESMLEDRDYHYLPKTKQNIVSEAKEDFKKSNIFLIASSVIAAILAIILFCYLLI